MLSHRFVLVARLLEALSSDNMKKYLLKQDLFNYKAGEEIDFNTYFAPSTGPTHTLNPVEIDIYTRIGILEEIDGEWKPKEYEEYWLVDSIGDVTFSFWVNSKGDKYRLSIGNVHRTEELAKAYRNSLIKK